LLTCILGSNLHTQSAKLSFNETFTARIRNQVCHKICLKGRIKSRAYIKTEVLPVRIWKVCDKGLRHRVHFASTWIIKCLNFIIICANSTNLTWGCRSALLLIQGFPKVCFFLKSVREGAENGVDQFKVRFVTFLGFRYCGAHLLTNLFSTCHKHQSHEIDINFVLVDAWLTNTFALTQR